MSRWTFTPEDREKPWCKRLTDEAETRLAELRTQNDADADAERTAKLRGQIKEVKRLLRALRDDNTTLTIDEAET